MILFGKGPKLLGLSLKALVMLQLCHSTEEASLAIKHRIDGNIDSSL
jgi:hypothetical protein